MALYSLCIKCKKKVGYKVKRCEGCQKEYNRYLNSKKVKDEVKMQFYGSRKWKQLRVQVLKDNNYMCEMCRNEGKVTEATQVHHKESLADAWDKRYEYTNLMPVCYNCHHKIHD